MKDPKQMLVGALLASCSLMMTCAQGAWAGAPIKIDAIQKKPAVMAVVSDVPRLELSVQAIRNMVAEKGYHFAVGETSVSRLSPEERKNLCGFISPSIDTNRLSGTPLLLSFSPSFDWRDYGGVTPVKNQLQCGSCWVFAAMGDLESKVLIAEDTTYDFSEQNLLSCNFYGYDCYLGGNSLMTTNFFTQTGSSLESCASYQGVNGISCGSSCAILENVDGWRYLASDTTTIKTALYEHGPIYTSMYASDPAFHVYTGGVYEYSGPEEPNHAVLIIGWDDALGPDGAWMVKNSWGTGWGMDGYFYIAYGDARIGEDSNYIASHKHCDAHETLLYYDEGGITSSIGDGSAVCYGAVVFTPGASGRLTAVDFWTVDDDISYEISIYDAMTGNTMGNLLASQSGNSAELGYYSVALNDPVPLAAGDDFVVSVRFTTTGYGYPVPLDDNSPLELGKCFLSLDGSSWMRIDEEGFFYDVAIRARVSADSDADGIIDASDNCPDDSNANQLDSDADGIGDVCDNCPMHSNGPAYGTCVRSLSEVVIGSEVPCTAGGQCEAGKTCQMEQGDCNGNGIGDVCECYADCDCSTNVNLSDLVMMKAQYLRDDCATNLCQADCNGDKQVNLSDLVIVKAQYFRNDCPSCL